MSWLRRLGERESRPAPAERVLTHRESTPAEHELREQLAHDPNDEAAFDALVEIVRERADEGTHLDPLTAAPETPVAQDHAVWALAEELAGQPRAWLPLIVLARLSLEADHESAMRRLHLACERETTGLALTHAVAMLRDADAPAEAIAFGVSHWELASRDPEAGGEVVLAALETGRIEEARRLLDSLEATTPALSARIGDLNRLVEAAEDRTA
ncbi:hypothetical protein C8046_01105 [Serinibacter arcticus]|uniref:TPR-repeat-containing protein n=2 Tax=Serinibacter arcticus TaxID=1655435 RepID=A0A2U1ZRA7_9MICO|nr:hypothetical protein C8046_01105 [Serinibacter arcticus]